VRATDGRTPSGVSRHVWPRGMTGLWIEAMAWTGGSVSQAGLRAIGGLSSI